MNEQVSAKKGRMRTTTLKFDVPLLRQKTATIDALTTGY